MPEWLGVKIEEKNQKKLANRQMPNKMLQSLH